MSLFVERFRRALLLTCPNVDEEEHPSLSMADEEQTKGRSRGIDRRRLSLVVVSRIDDDNDDDALAERTNDEPVDLAALRSRWFIIFTTFCLIRTN